MTRLGIFLELCPILQPRSLRTLESQRAKIIKDAGGNRRRVSAVDGLGRGCGGRGRGRGRGGLVRGQGLGRSNGLFFDEVDFQGFKQRFHPSEMQQMYAEGISYITQKCTEANNNKIW